MTRLLIQAALLPFPWALRRRLLCWLLGFDIHPSAYIGASIILSGRLNMAERSRIGHLSFVKGLTSVALAPHAMIGNLNWITGVAANDTMHFSDNRVRNPSLIVGAHSAITHRHLLDCTDTLEIGRFTTFAGWRSQVLTHSIELHDARQRSAPVSIGDYCFVGTGCIILKGSRLPNFSVLAAGSVLTEELTDEHALYAGSPARKKQDLEADLEYFKRERGYIE